MEDALSSAVQGRGRDAEHVLNRHRDSHLLMPLRLPQAHEEIAIFIGMIQLEGGEDVGLGLHLESGVLLPIAKAIRVFKLHQRGGVFDWRDPRDHLAARGSRVFVQRAGGNFGGGNGNRGDQYGTTAMAGESAAETVGAGDGVDAAGADRRRAAVAALF